MMASRRQRRRIRHKIFGAGCIASHLHVIALHCVTHSEVRRKGASGAVVHPTRDPMNAPIACFSAASRRRPLLWGLPLYALTCICVPEYTKRMESVFEIIAEPNRRAILSLLVSSQRSVGEIERQLRMPQPTVSKHLRVLREAGFVESTVDAQRRLYRLKPEPLQEVDAWLAQFRRFWSVHVDALERHLDRMEQSTPTKRKTRRTR
jgi:DNA-binding transcriptional ArsR family regulator